LVELGAGCVMIVAGVFLAVQHRWVAERERRHRLWLAEHPWVLSRTYFAVGAAVLLGVLALFSRGDWAAAPLLVGPVFFILGNRWVVRLQLWMWRVFPEPPAGALIPVGIWCAVVGAVCCIAALEHPK
jgi:hypothetical protein